MLSKMTFVARIGRPCGEPFLVAPFLAKHPQFAWQKPVLGDMKGQSLGNISNRRSQRFILAPIDERELIRLCGKGTDKAVRLRECKSQLPHRKPFSQEINATATSAAVMPTAWRAVVRSFSSQIASRIVEAG